MDLSGLDASPDEVGAILDAIAETEADTWTSAHDAEAEAAADWAASLSDSEFSEMLASYEADSRLPGPQLAGAYDAESGIDLANEMGAVDMMLATMTDREATRQREDQAQQGRRRPSTEMRLMAGMDRAARGTLTYGGTPATDLANWGGGDPDIDALLAAGPVAGRQDVISELTYQLHGGIAPSRARRQPGLPPVSALSRQIGLR
jgi:hypothetical protein